MQYYNTPHKKKKYIENEFRTTASIVDMVSDKSRAVFLRGYCVQRRIRAILSVLDRAEAEFGPLCKEPVIEFLTRAEIRPLITYNDADWDDEVTIGAAIWILEKMRRTEKFYDMKKILPDLTGMDVLYLPMDFNHPCFTNELIESVMYVLKNKHKSGYIACERSAKREKPSSVYTQLMEMLPNDDVERACKAFTEKQWDLLCRYIKCDSIIKDEIAQRDNRLKALESPLANPNSITDKEIDRIAEEGDHFEQLRRDFTRSFSDYLNMTRRQVIRETGSRAIANEVTGFSLDDPYEICFAIYYLIETDEDMPWLISSGTQLVMYAAEMLPWSYDDSDWDDEKLESWYGGMHYDYNGWIEEEPAKENLDFHTTKHNGRTLAQLVYDMSRGVVPFNLHPFEQERQQLIDEGMDESVARRVVDIAEILFLREFQDDAYKAFDFGGAAGTGTDTVTEKEEEEAAEGTHLLDDTVVAELESAKKEIKALRAALYKERKDADAERAKAERELKTLRMEHRELADLRSLLFNREAEDQERIERIEKEYEYPYETRKRTVVFGGHDSFLRAFKPLFSNIKFIDPKNLSYDVDVIRNADVVWIQNNCIAHSQYWSVVKNCKLAGVQLRYFGFASAEKCAEQLVTEDMK